MQDFKATKELILRGALYTMFTATLVWFLVFLMGIYEYHYTGSNPVNMGVPIPHHLDWETALAGSARIAGIAAAMILMVGTAVVMLMSAAAWLMMQAIKINKRKQNIQ
jgi:hypothetical protein